MEKQKAKLTKAERIHSRKAIEALFASGERWTCYPFRLALQTKLENPDGEPPFQLLVSVSKRNFKKAVDRNLIKRRIREAFRLNKATFYQQIGGGQSQNNGEILQIAFIYQPKKIEDWDTINKRVIRALTEACQKWKNKSKGQQENEKAI